MTKAERALLEAALQHWITGSFNHLIVAVHKERSAALPRKLDESYERYLSWKRITGCDFSFEQYLICFTDTVHAKKSVRVARKRKKR